MEQHAGNASRGQGAENTTEESRDGDADDITGALGGNLGENADLNTEGANVAEALSCMTQLVSNSVVTTQQKQKNLRSKHRWQ